MLYLGRSVDDESVWKVVVGDELGEGLQAVASSVVGFGHDTKIDLSLLSKINISSKEPNLKKIYFSYVDTISDN